MKTSRYRPTLLLVPMAFATAGCFSSQAPQASEEAAKQFSGGPMPPDVQKKFQESMKKNPPHGPQNGGKQ